MSEFGYLRGLFKQIPLKNWKDLLSKYNHEAAEVSKSSLKLSCVTPTHSDNTPSAFIDVGKGHYICYGCRAYTTDPSVVYQHITKCSSEEAHQALSDTFGIVLNNNKNTIIKRQQQSRQTKLRIVAYLNWVLKKCFTSPHPDFSFSSDAKKWINNRKISITILLKCKVGILPPIKIIQRLVPDFLKENPQINISAADLIDDTLNYFDVLLANTINYGALLFPFYNAPDDVGRIQVRVDFLSKNTTNTKFFFAGPSETAKKAITDMFDVPVGFFGMPMIEYAKNTQIDVAFLTEGATDTISILTGQVAKFGRVNYPTFGVPGTGNLELDLLLNNGISRAFFCQDAPEHSGNTVFFACTEKTKKLPLLAFTWPTSLVDANGELPKDIDTAIQLHGIDKVWQDGIGKLKENFIPAYKFAINQVIEETNSSDSPSLRDEVIEKYGTKLGNDSDKKEFVKFISAQFDIDKKDILQVIFEEENSERGFLERIKKELREHFLFIAIASGERKGNPLLVVWDKKRKNLLYIDWESSNSIKILDSSLGGRVNWSENTIGLPRIITHRRRGKIEVKRELIELKKVITEYIGMGLGEISAELPLETRLRKISNGVHYLGANELLIVNGRHAFLGHISEKETKVSWKEVSDTPIINNSFLIDFQNADVWSKTLTSIKNLEEGNKVDLAEVFNKYLEIFNKAWTFTHQEVDSVYLACLVLYSAIYDAIDRMLMTFITANQSSGKTTLVKYLFGGDQAKSKFLPSVPFFVYQEFGNQTPAGLEQTFCGYGGQVKLGCVIDEFEDDSTKAHQKQEKMFSLFRGMLETEAIGRKGTRSGKVREIRLKFPVLLAGICQFRDRTGAVESRLYTIYPKSVDGHKAPEDIIKSLNIDVEDLSFKLTVGVFKHLEEIRTAHAYMRDKLSIDLRENLIKDLKAFGGLSQRRLDAQSVVAGILKVVGWSEEDIYEYIVKSLRTKAVSSGDNLNKTEGDRIFDDLLSSPLTDPSQITLQPHTITLREALFNSEYRSDITSAMAGVFFLKKKKYLIVHWNTIMQNVWKNHSLRGSETPERLMQITSRNTNCVEKSKIKRKTFLMNNITDPNGCTIFDITSIINQGDEAERLQKETELDFKSKEYIEELDHLN